MSIREDILDQFGDDAHTMLFADGFDDALVGVGSAFGGDLCAIYARSMMRTQSSKAL